MKEKGGKHTFYHFVRSCLQFEIFLNKRENQKKGALKYRIETLTSLHSMLRFQKKSLQSLSALLGIFAKKRILKSLFSFIPWLLNSSDLPSSGSNSTKRYTSRLLSICLGRSTPYIGVKVPFHYFLNSLRWASFSTKWCKIYTKTVS